MDRKANDLLYRQVHPKHCSGDQPNSLAFNPSLEHAYKLSVDDARIVDAEQSHRHFTENLGMNSAGTWAVSIKEVGGLSSLEVEADPVECPDDPKMNNPAHTLIVFDALDSKGQRKRYAQALAIHASERGCLHSG